MTRLFGAFAMAMAAPLAAQQAAAPPQQGPDVIVEGILVPPDEASHPLTNDLSGGDPRQSAVANRIRLEFSTRFAECVGRGKFTSTELLRAAVDGMPYDASQRFAQGRLAQIYTTCYVDTSFRSILEPQDLGRSLWDRGALVIESMRRYAPDLTLTRAQLDDPAVQARLNRREVPRNRRRLPLDRDFFKVAVCMVRYQPTLSVRLALDERSPASRLRIENAIVDGARPCVGNARHVLFEPTQLRLYLADAVYRWAVAARGVESLIPEPVVVASRDR